MSSLTYEKIDMRFQVAEGIFQNLWLPDQIIFISLLLNPAHRRKSNLSSVEA